MWEKSAQLAYVSVMTMVLAAFGKMMKHDETVTVSSLEMHALCV